MDLLALDELGALAAQDAAPCVSLFMPTHRAGEDTRQDPIRFKNLLGRAALQTVLKGGTVYAVEPEAVPGSAPLAALSLHGAADAVSAGAAICPASAKAEENAAQEGDQHPHRHAGPKGSGPVGKLPLRSRCQAPGMCRLAKAI